MTDNATACWHKQMESQAMRTCHSVLCDRLHQGVIAGRGCGCEGADLEADNLMQLAVVGLNVQSFRECRMSKWHLLGPTADSECPMMPTRIEPN